jgi:transaldolase/glucose-6-phosphate isomerase
VSRLKISLPESLAAAVKATVADWQSGGKIKRLWDRDASLWTGDDESKWLGWLDIVEEQIAQHGQLEKFAKEVQARGFQLRRPSRAPSSESTPLTNRTWKPAKSRLAR